MVDTVLLRRCLPRDLGVMAVAMTDAVMNRARCVVPSHTIYAVARPCAVRTHHSQSHKAARLTSRLLRPAFNTAAAERAVLGLWPRIRPVTGIDSELGSTLTVRRAHRELLAAACIDINVVRKVIVTPHSVRGTQTKRRPWGVCLEPRSARLHSYAH